MKTKMKLYQKNILSALVIAFGGFTLFNLAFIFAAFIINTTISVLGMPQNSAPPVAAIMLYLLLICSISWFVFHLRFNDLVKATFLTMPLMIILVMVGIIFYQHSKWVVFGIGAVIICTVLLYLHKKKSSWLYYFSIFYVAALAFCVMLFNVQI